jgi:hypothetical protein
MASEAKQSRTLKIKGLLQRFAPRYDEYKASSANC